MERNFLFISVNISFLNRAPLLGVPHILFIIIFQDGPKNIFKPK
jgi:hypothetical protein